MLLLLHLLSFNNNMSSVITPLDFDSDNISLIQISRLHNGVLFAIFFFEWKSKIDSNIKTFIDYLLKAINQIHGSLTVPSIKCLPPKIGVHFFSRYVILDFSNFTLTRSANLEYLC